MKNTNKRKGISLIVLVITILVMIILAGVVVVSLQKNNPIEKAKEATFKQSLAQIGEELEMFCVNEKAQNSEFNKESLHASKNNLAFNTKKESSGKNIYDIIPSLKDSKYKNQVEVIQGMLFYRTPDKKEIPWLKELGIHYTGIVTGTVEIEGDTLVGVSPDYVNTGTLVIPNTVKKINPGAFSGCKDLNAVVLPEGITEIPDNCFRECDSLTSVEIPNSVNVIGDSAFRACSSLTKIKLPTSLTEMKPFAFYWCRKLVNVEFNENLQIIGDKSFSYTGIENLNLKNKVTTIGVQAFEEIPSKSVTIPNSVTTVKDYAFLGSRLESLHIGSKAQFGKGVIRRTMNLTNLTVDSNNPYLSAMDNALYNKDKTILLSGPYKATTYVMPNTVTKIEESAFNDAIRLESATLSTNLLDIGNYAFEKCTNLVSLHIPSKVNHIGKRVIEACSSLTNLTIDENNQYYKIYNGAILTKNGDTIISCADVNTSFTIPNTVKNISNSAFARCKKLKNITIPSSVVSLDNEAFREAGLESLVVPGSIKTMNWGAFRFMPDIKNIVFEEGVKELKGNLFYNNTSLTEITLPSSIEIISGDVLAGSSALQRINIPDSNTRYKSYKNMILSKDGKILYSCSDTNKVTTIPNGVEIVWEFALHNNQNLTEVRLPNTIKEIKSNAFLSDVNLQKVTIPSSILNISSNAFENTAKLSEIIIDKPKGSIQGAPWGATQGIKAIIWQ